MILPPNHTMQPTAGQRNALLHIMETRPLEATHAVAGGG